MERKNSKNFGLRFAGLGIGVGGILLGEGLLGIARNPHLLRGEEMSLLVGSGVVAASFLTGAFVLRKKLEKQLNH